MRYIPNYIYLFNSLHQSLPRTDVKYIVKTKNALLSAFRFIYFMKLNISCTSSEIAVVHLQLPHATHWIVFQASQIMQLESSVEQSLVSDHQARLSLLH